MHLWNNGYFSTVYSYCLIHTSNIELITSDSSCSITTVSISIIRGALISNSIIFSNIFCYNIWSRFCVSIWWIPATTRYGNINSIGCIDVDCKNLAIAYIVSNPYHTIHNILQALISLKLLASLYIYRRLSLYDSIEIWKLSANLLTAPVYSSLIAAYDKQQNSLTLT